jgi:hypothetical protein
VWNFEVISDKCNVAGICTSGNYTYKWINTWYNYSFVVLSSLTMETEMFEGMCHKTLPELLF